MNKKFVFVLLAGVLLISSLSIHFYNKIGANQIRIGATYMNMNNTFYKAINDEIAKVVNNNGDILYVRNPALNSAKQVEQIYDFIGMDCNVIIINPVNSNDININKALHIAKLKGIILILVDSHLEDESDIDCTIVSDNYEAGCQCARNMMKTLDQGTIMLIEHNEALSAADRMRGFKKTIKGHSEFKIVSRCDGNGQTEVTLPVVVKELKKHPDIDVIFGENDPSALGAVAAIKQVGLKKMPLVYGVDGSPDAKRIIATTNEIKGTSAQSPIEMGQKAVEIAYQLCEHRAEQKIELMTSVRFISKENINSYDVSGWQ